MSLVEQLVNYLRRLELLYLLLLLSERSSALVLPVLHRYDTPWYIR